MREYEWLDIFEFGIPEIDYDHLALFALVRAVQTSVKAGNRQQSFRLLDRLLAFVEMHFSREEALLRQWGYEDVETHAFNHAKLRAVVFALKRPGEELEPPDALGLFSEALIGFLVDDIIRSDMEFKSFLENKGLVLRG